MQTLEFIIRLCYTVIMVLIALVILPFILLAQVSGDVVQWIRRRV